MSASQWDCCLRISPAHYQRNRQFLKAEEFHRNSVILTGKYNKEYRLHVARQFCMLCKTLSLCLSLHVRRRVVRLHTRVYGTPNTQTQVRCASIEMKNIKERLTDSETLKRSVSVFGEWKYISAKLILSLQLTHWRAKSEKLLAIG